MTAPAIEAILADVDGICGKAGCGDGCGCPDGLAEVLTTAPDLADQVRAMLVLASLGGLAGLPLSELKIDSRLTAALPEQGADLRLVRGIVQLGHSLGLAVSAQGVDKEVAFERLLELGCDYAQGEQIAPAMDGKALMAWVNQTSAASS